MAQQNIAGLRLRQATNSRNKNTLWLIQTAVAILAAVVLVLSVAGLTGNSVAAMMVAVLWLSVVYGILLRTGYENWFYPGVLVVALILTLVCRNQVLEGFRLFWNESSDAMVRGTGWVIPEWKLQLDGEQADLSIALFGCMIGCMISILCCGLVSAAPAILALLLPGILLIGMSLFDADAHFALLLPALGISVLILMYSGWRKKGSAAPVVAGWAICVPVACLLICGALLPGMQSWSERIHDDVYQRIHDNRYETKYTTLPEGDFTDYRKTEQKAEPALAVTMENPQQMYLRGFTGAVFAGDRWETLETEALAKNKDLLYWLNLNAFDQNAQFDAAAAYAGMEQSTVTIQNIGACSYYRYVPFSIEKGAWAQPENLNTDGVYGEGERSYVYSVTAGNADDVMQVLTHLQTSGDPAVLQYRKAESGYRQFINHYYLQVPENVKALLGKQWDEIAGKYGSSNNLTLQQAQECTLVFLSGCFPEEGVPENMELPLEIAEGTTFQYATVAAMTLRYFGIPARYAEGYVISAEMAAGFESGETMTVDSSCAKAWVEVYQDGIGWIPMDIMPGMGDMLGNYGGASASSSGSGEGTSGMNTAEKQPQEEKEEPQEEEEQQPPSGGSVVMLLLRMMLRVLIVLSMILAVLLLILWVRRKLRMKQKEKRFQNENCRDAVAWIYADAALILEKLGFSRENGSMRSLRQPLEEKFGAEFAARFEYVSDLNDRAMFSSLPLNEEQRSDAREFHSRVLGKLKPEVKWYRRMWLKWVQCLY